MMGVIVIQSMGTFIVDDIKVMLKSFDFASLQYVSRNCNKAAHVLAKSSLNVWLDPCPPCVDFIVHYDISFPNRLPLFS